jgi:hypothetical protein
MLYELSDEQVAAVKTGISDRVYESGVYESLNEPVTCPRHWMGCVIDGVHPELRKAFRAGHDDASRRFPLARSSVKGV